MSLTSLHFSLLTLSTATDYFKTMINNSQPAYDKTYNMTRKDSDQPVNPPSMARVLVYPSLDSPETVEGT